MTMVAAVPFPAIPRRCKDKTEPILPTGTTSAVFALTMATAKSSLSTESPPFNPNRIMSRGRNSPGGGGGGQYGSRSSSPYPPAFATATATATVTTSSQAPGSSSSSSGGGGGGGYHPNSNATPKFTFQDPTTG